MVVVVVGVGVAATKITSKPAAPLVLLLILPGSIGFGLGISMRGLVLTFVATLRFVVQGAIDIPRTGEKTIFSPTFLFPLS